jgi:hypothetical protein
MCAPLPLLLAKNASFGNYLAGTLDEAAVYKRALTAADVAAHYAAASQTSSQGQGGNAQGLWWMSQGGDVDSYNVWQPITVSDTANLPRGVCGGLFVGGGGDVAAVMENNQMPVILTAVPAGSWIPLAVKRVNATGTTATSLVALYEV